MKKILSTICAVLVTLVLIACEPVAVTETFEVTFELNNGEPAIVRTVNKNALVEQPGEPIRDGYEFDLWYKDENLTVQWVFLADRITENTKIYAGWNILDEEEAYNIDMWIESSYVNVLRDFVKTNDSNTVAELSVAKNEYESLQILLRSTLTFDVLDVTFSDLTDQNGHAISKDNLAYNYVEHEYFLNNSPGVSSNDVIINGAGYYPDALSNEKTFNVVARRTLPIWITLYTPKDTIAGDYTGRIKVETSHGVIYVPFEVTVYDVLIPDAGSQDAQFENVFWQLMIGSGFATVTAENHGNEVMKLTFGLDRWTNDWWHMVGEIADVMKAYRINSLYVQTVSLLVDGGSRKNADGTYTFNWSKFDEYIEFFIDRGIINSFYGFMMMTDKSTYAISEYNGVPAARRIDFDSDESDRFYEAYLPALQEHLREKGWLDRWIQSISDEPVMTGDNFRHYQELVEMVNRLAPDLRYGDPTQHYQNSKYARDIESPVLIPLTEVHYNNYDSWYKNVGENQTVFTYTCVIPQGSWLNRFIDKPVYHGRHIGWYNFGHNATGFLHWGLMAWYRPITDFALGDTASIYPDIENNTIKSSIRLASLRDGVEDYEILYILAETNPELAKQLADAIAADPHKNYTKDIDYMIEIREILLKAASGETVNFK